MKKRSVEESGSKFLPIGSVQKYTYGIAAITWAGVVPTMNGKSNVGARYSATSRNSKSIVPNVN